MKEGFPRYPRAVSDRESLGRPAQDRAEHVIAVVNSLHTNLELLKKRGEPIVMAETLELLETLGASLDISPKNVGLLRKEFKFSETKVADDPAESVGIEERAEEKERHEVS